MMELLVTQLIGSEEERMNQVRRLEQEMLPQTKSIQTYVKGKLVMELAPQ
jgi:hypothetical protein